MNNSNDIYDFHIAKTPILFTRLFYLFEDVQLKGRGRQASVPFSLNGQERKFSFSFAVASEKEISCLTFVYEMDTLRVGVFSCLGHHPWTAHPALKMLLFRRIGSISVCKLPVVDVFMCRAWCCYVLNYTCFVGNWNRVLF